MAEWLLSKPIAHRGLHREQSVPENSLAAFNSAVSAGYPIELDIRMPRNGPPIVFHDQELERLTGADGAISDSDFGALAELSLYSTDQKIPSLQQVLNLVNGRVPLLVELKTEDHSARLEIETCRILSGYIGDFAVQSFDSFSVAWFKNNSPRFLRGLVFESLNDISQEDLDACNPDFLACEHLNLPDAKPEKTLLAWTVCNEEEARAARKVADNLIFEDFLPSIA